MVDLNCINFRTVIKPLKYNFDINYKSKLMFIGSCFTENIGYELQKSKFDIDINPFGIIYNPISVKNSLKILLNKTIYTENDIFYFNQRWNSFNHHGRFSNNNKNKALENINTRIENSSEFLESLDYLFITFGTAWVYEKDETGNVVANCHKLPSNNFNKKLLSVEEIINSYTILHEKLLKINKKIKIIYTISPVRHLKDGFYENNISKSILRLAIDKLINNNNESYYFPAYEIMLDDLRDYRYYDSDLLHPNKIAIEYILKYFKNTFFTKETNKIFEELIKIQKAMNHKPFNPLSKEYKKFKEHNMDKINKLIEKYKYLDFSEELSYFKKK